MSGDRRPCRRCGLAVAVTSSGHLRSHACPHGRNCQPSYAQRRAGVRAQACASCAGASADRNQLALFDLTKP